jgi:hypothetical protein
MELFIIASVVLLAPVVAVTDLLALLLTGRQVVNKVVFVAAEIVALIILPIIYLGINGDKNDCCGDSAVFAPDHVFSIIVLMIICLIAYFYSSYRDAIAPPVIELIVNLVLVTTIVLNIFIAMHTGEPIAAAIGNMPIISFCFFSLVRNHRLLMDAVNESPCNQRKGLSRLACKILSLQAPLKFPLMLILCLPLLVVIASLLLLFGQRPDSMIRAFTDTYKHGLSQLDYQCDNVQCGGHFLCSVAANGHPKLVKPERAGVRNGGNIICNRQLLIANAFEDIIQQTWPSLHRFIRKHYDKVGDIVHKNGDMFSNKCIANCMYIVMKPLEWLFLVILYTADHKPENRIAKQYISLAHRQQLDEYYAQRADATSLHHFN